VGAVLVVVLVVGLREFGGSGDDAVAFGGGRGEDAMVSDEA